ncbi:MULTISPECIES: NAD(P)/FAD-dependent oxidoreductase [Mycolicibacterium]|uniref:FAD-dependent pyridine nucleotide-disulfide oxidoreductase n=1 Tax=Mycolicibacterium vanbaalenii (strain DSM 7251 / JCM 13017 / BCRC 16820 / KCTC 9966 / NRRL B-24157 / PYR-1) TaxID=350058 RepID=A1T4M4_MYCVP|nr:MULTISPECIES: FAD-dependent oxidoreductase [Mycolicibacterium]ABM12124.1 FAD-dependent pyridine nucleotide-disulfide oxidoreductase [Mycolicibacterium vanbaalenii PYR-1]MCV7127181.1 FAD-dependent oxidoreductase [Mycolicibacterium vanbaalenii PYR-1]PQP45044.1 FAD-dependent oxidoreductase [Mycolicibacterium austroafricanum]UJL31131.1 FAD-dependent oxidoreductase [Mycolicibacterium vanbaalenii]WND57967.1 FAD-dependent oxidoreductase [Mycolicibacterium vanbaalenii]
MTTSEVSGGVVIVGGGLAAARTAEQLRRSEYAGAITIVSDEGHLPYDRPPLSKEVLRAETDDVTLKPAEFYTENNITVLLGNGAKSVDTDSRTLTLADGTQLGYDELIIATGLVPKRIPSFPDLPGIHVLRNFDESLALRQEAGTARRAVVVGAGFIGCEVAASLRKLGVEVVLVEPQPAPLASVLGQQIGELVTRLHRAEGVDVRCGVGVSKVSGDDRVRKVTLGDGTELDADIVVVGIGSHPATEWLADSGLEIDNGVVCDEAGRASAPHVWAIGDVASWRDNVGGQVRVEHWSNVADQARVLVPTMLGQQPPAAVSVPYFWSDQYDVKIQALGEPEATDTVHIVEDDGRKFLAYYERDGVVVGVVGGGFPGKVMKVRAKIAAGAPISELLG